MNTLFDTQLAGLREALLKMATRVESLIADTDKAFLTQDKALAEKTIAADDEVDGMEKEIERLCLALLASSPPEARDLRLVTSVLKMTTDLERIGDHATDISQLVAGMTGKPYIKKLVHIPQMAAATMKMILRSIDAYVKEDADLAQAVIEHDEEVDHLFDVVKKEIIEIINAGVTDGKQAVELLMIAKYFERIGDHATNIAEWVIFTLTGRYKDETVS